MLDQKDQKETLLTILFILYYELFTKDLLSLDTCASVTNNLCEKLASSLESPIRFNESLLQLVKVTSVLFFIPDLNLLT